MLNSSSALCIVNEAASQGSDHFSSWLKKKTQHLHCIDAQVNLFVVETRLEVCHIFHFIDTKVCNKDYANFELQPSKPSKHKKIFKVEQQKSLGFAAWENVRVKKYFPLWFTWQWLFNNHECSMQWKVEKKIKKTLANSTSWSGLHQVNWVVKNWGEIQRKNSDSKFCQLEI